MRRVGGGAFERLEVREQMLDEKCADGNDAEQGMELAPKKGSALTGAQRLYACDGAWAS